MKMTKFGLKVSFFAAALYLGAILDPVVPLLMIAYAVLAENSEEMHKMAFQAALVLGGVWLLDGIYKVLSNLVSFFNTFVGNGQLHMPYGLAAAMPMIESVILLVFALLALVNRYAMINVVSLEGMLNKGKMSIGKTASPTGQNGEGEAQK